MPKCNCGAEYVQGAPYCMKCFSPLDVFIPPVEPVAQPGGAADGGIPGGAPLIPVPDAPAPVGEPSTEPVVPAASGAPSVAPEPAQEGEPADDPKVVNEPDEPPAPVVPAAPPVPAPAPAPAAPTPAVRSVPPVRLPVGAESELWPADWCRTCGADLRTPLCAACRAQMPDAVCPACSSLTVRPTLYLEVEGFVRVKFGFYLQKRVPVTMDVLRFGRVVAATNSFPDVDLSSCHEGGKKQISRLHAEIRRRWGDPVVHELVCLTSNENTTHLTRAGTDETISLSAKDAVRLAHGDRFVLGREVSFRVIVPED